MPGAKRPYILTDSVDLVASAAGQAVLRVGSNERFEGHAILILSTGIFNITGITDDSGLPFTNADAGDPLTNVMFPDDMDAGDAMLELDAPLVLEKNNALTISFTDTSTAANTVRVAIYGTMESLPS